MSGHLTVGGEFNGGASCDGKTWVGSNVDRASLRVSEDRRAEVAEAACFEESGSVTTSRGTWLAMVRSSSGARLFLGCEGASAQAYRFQPELRPMACRHELDSPQRGPS